MKISAPALLSPLCASAWAFTQNCPSGTGQNEGITAFQSSQIDNIPSCAANCVLVAETQIGCTDANCDCSQAPAYTSEISRCIAVSCTDICENLSAGLVLVTDYCSFMAQCYGMTLAPLTAPPSCGTSRKFPVDRFSRLQNSVA